MDLARTKRKLSLILIVYSNKIENRVNLSGDGNKSGKKKSIGIISKKKKETNKQKQKQFCPITAATKVKTSRREKLSKLEHIRHFLHKTCN